MAPLGFLIMNKFALSSLTFLAFLAPVSAQSLTVAEGPAQGQLQIRVHDERQATLPSRIFLEKVEFLPLEVTLRTDLQKYRTDRARRTQRQGLWRVELPGGGRIFRYRRAGGTRYGFLLIKADGMPSILLELPGLGMGGLSDPFADRFGVAADGQNAAVSTVAGALYHIRLDGRSFVSSKTPARSIAVTGIVEAKSLAVGKRVLFYQTGKTRLWRLALVDASKPVEVGPKIVTGGRLKEEMALAGNGTRLAFLAGPKKLQHIYIVGEAGKALRITSKAAKYEDAGYLPETVMGPTLLFDDTGTKLFYVDSTIREELYLRDLLKAGSALHITSNTNFQPYIGTGVLPVFLSGKLMVGIGNPKAFDWYLADPAKGTVQNLSRSPGNTKAPFGAGLLDIQGSGSLAGRDSMVVEALKGGAYRLRLFPIKPPHKPLVIDGLQTLPHPGSSSAGSADILVSRKAGDIILDEAQAKTLIALPSPFRLASPIKTAYFRFFMVEISGFQVPVFYEPQKFLLVLPPSKGTSLPILSPAGALVLHGSKLLYFGPRWATSLPPAKGIRRVLSGQGA